MTLLNKNCSIYTTYEIHICIQNVSIHLLLPLSNRFDLKSLRQCRNEDEDEQSNDVTFYSKSSARIQSLHLSS